VPLEVVEEGAGLPVVQGLEEVAGVPQEAWLIRSSEVLYEEVKLVTMGPGDDSEVGMMKIKVLRGDGARL
jgi:hypothetical protein